MKFAFAIVVAIIACLLGGARAQCNPNTTLAVVDAYLGYAFAGNLSAASVYLSNDFVFNWHGPQNLIPIAGTFSGAAGLGQFFGNVFSRVTNFHFETSYAPATGGVRTVAYSCENVVKQWQEISVVMNTGKPIYRATNTVIYAVNSGSNLITQADVWIDSMQYAQAFCPGQIACFSNITAISGFDVVPSGELDRRFPGLFGLLIAVLAVLLVNLVVLVCLCARARPSQGGGSELGTRLTASSY